MANENKVTIDITIDGQNQIDQSIKAFDSLRKSITGLSQPLNALSKNLNILDKNLSNHADALSQMNSQHDKVVSTGDKVADKVSGIATSFTTLESIINICGITIKGWQIALTGGLAAVMAFLPELINFAKSIFKGKEAIDQAKLSMDSLNKGISSTEYSKAIENITRLKVKVDLAKRGFIDKNDVIKDYNDSVGETIGKVKTLDQVETTLKNNAGSYIQMMLNKATAMAAIKEAADQQILAEKELNKSDEESVSWAVSGLDKSSKLYKASAIRNRETAAEPFKKSAAALELIAARYMSEASKFSKVIEENSPVNTINKQLQKLQKQSDAKTINSTTFSEIKRLKKELADLETPSNDFSYNSKRRNNKPAPPVDAKREPSLELEFNTGKFVKDSLDQSVQQSLDAKSSAIVKNVQLTHQRVSDLDAEAAKKKIALEEGLNKAKINFGEKFIDAALKNSKKDSAIYKAAFLAKKATAIADTIISTKNAVMESFKAYAGIPFIGQALGIAQAVFMGAQGAMSIADIAKQKPGFAGGGQFRSDGKGALLSGYSRADDTNAYLRSGEAVVVSEAMRNPWARNLVSAINVAHGGRDFSVANPGRGYAIGGIFTDGGNTNRYYSQPLNDQKDLANTIAYQMINNFPPVYVDVKDINTQQNILARTVDRVNL